MSQAYNEDCYSGTHQAQTDLQDFENNFAALKSCFSGSTMTVATEAGMQWYDTTKKVTKRRNSTDTAWHGLMNADASQKIWVYRNAAMEGWVIDAAAPTDIVLALKGGSTYVTGGAQAGTWQTVGHIITTAELPNINVGNATVTGGIYQWWGASGDNDVVICSPYLTLTSGPLGGTTPAWILVNSTYYKIIMDPHLHALGGSSTAHDHGATQRIAAAVGTLQYMDL